MRAILFERAMCRLLTDIVNRYLWLDPMNRARLQSLHSKTMLIKIQPTNIVLRCETQTTGLLLRSTPAARDHDADVTISGTWLSWLAALMQRDKQALFVSGDLTLIGSAEIGQHFMMLLSSRNIDWEECLSQVVGDIGAYYIGYYGRLLLDWREHASASCVQDIDEYLHEEIQLLPTKSAIQTLLIAVDTLRDETDCLVARVNQLIAMSKQTQTTLQPHPQVG